MLERIPGKTETRVREEILSERPEKRNAMKSLASEFISFRQFWILLLSKVSKRICLLFYYFPSLRNTICPYTRAMMAESHTMPNILHQTER